MRLYRCNFIISFHYNNVKNIVQIQVQNGDIMNKDIEYKIGQNIRIIRESRGMTQDTLAAKLQLEGCDITRSAVAKIEVGQRHLYPDEILLIRKILNVTYDQIFDIEHD